jgi:hypothetical protein
MGRSMGRSMAKVAVEKEIPHKNPARARVEVLPKALDKSFFMLLNTFDLNNK